VFINYRGEDSHSYGALLYAELVRHFGDDQVFLDCESIPAGADFVEELLGRVRQARVVLAVIGSRWLTATDADGRRRIDAPGDWIRRELAEAFAAGVRVIPILTEQAEIPAQADLPAEIARLCRCQFRRLRYRDPMADLARIVTDLTSVVPAAAVVGGHGGVPRQLPAAPSGFTGRAGELAVLTAALDAVAGQGGSVVISAIGGAGGIGKTWLGLHWAHEHLDRFPDGQLFVDLRGFSPDGTPLSPGHAVRVLLDGLGVDPESIPADVQAQLGRYRSLVADRRMLIVLDNARDAAQVTGLLPGSPGCLVLITSRDRLDGLAVAHGVRQLAVDVLDESDARALLTCRIGQVRVDAEPDAVTTLVACCGGLPLALSIVAGRAAAQPAFPLAVLAAEVREAATRLGALDTGDPATAVEAVLSWSYAALTEEQARVFGLLGIAPGVDISVPAAASLVGVPVAQARLVLRALCRVSLVEEHTPGRYRMHDLTRLVAAKTADRDQSCPGRDAALLRLVDFYLRTAHAGDRLLDPHGAPLELEPPVAGAHPEPLLDESAALAWFDAEHPGLLAVLRSALDRGWYSRVWQLAWCLDTFYYRRGDAHDYLAVWQAGMGAAEQLEDLGIQARAHRRYGTACTRAGRYADAVDHLQQALAVAERKKDRLDQARTHRELASPWALQGDHQQSLHHATRALELFQGLDIPIWQARTHNEIARCWISLGDHDQAGAHCRTALTLFRRLDDHEGEADALGILGRLAHHAGHHDQAVDYFQQSLAICRVHGYFYGEASTLARLGRTHAVLGDDHQARVAWQQALHLYLAQHRSTAADRIQHYLADLGEPPA